MKAGRFIVRISRWMARSLHELAARIERWSGAASTPPPAAPPLPDPAMQALAERFPGAPEHWLRLVAGRMGIGAASAATGSSRPPQARRLSVPQDSIAFPSPAGAPRSNRLLGSGKDRNLRSAWARFIDRTPDRRAPADWPEPERLERPPAESAPPVSGAAHVEPIGFAPNRSEQRPDPEFPVGAPEHALAQVHFPDFAANRTRPVQSRPALGLARSPAFPGIPETTPDKPPSDAGGFAPLGGEWRSGYEVRQPGELHNIWPELPPRDLVIPDAQPLLPDEEAIRLEQMVARWSA